MNNQVKEISETLKQEFVIASKPQADWRQFVYLVVQRYKLTTNSIYGWVLYDWLDERGHIKHTSDELKQATLKGNGEVNRAKSFLMDNLIAKKVITVEQIEALL